MKDKKKIEKIFMKLENINLIRSGCAREESLRIKKIKMKKKENAGV